MGAGESDRDTDGDASVILVGTGRARARALVPHGDATKAPLRAARTTAPTRYGRIDAGRSSDSAERWHRPFLTDT
jgi:hypothetical protein